MKFIKARKHELKLHLIIGILYFSVLIFCFWVYFLNQIPKFQFNNKEIVINIDYLFIGLLVVLLLILQLTIGLNYFFNKQFMS